MSSFDPHAPQSPQESQASQRFQASDDELRLATRKSMQQQDEDDHAERLNAAPAKPRRRPLISRLARAILILVPTLALLGVIAFFAAQQYIRSAARASLPQVEGSLTLPGLSAPVTVLRDSHGVPHIQATTVDDLVLAQGFVVAQDRLFQMDSLRRHAAGELAEILGPNLLQHDRLQRTLQIRAAADRAVTALPPDQLHLLEQYAKGVNAAINAQASGKSSHLPVEFRILRYTPAPWTPRDSILVALAMFEDLTNTFPTKLAREALTARLPADLVPDLYPVGSWRDHPPSTPEPDLTIPGPPIEQVPLDESQASVGTPTTPGAPHLASEMWASNASSPFALLSTLFPLPSLSIRSPLTTSPSGPSPCLSCTPGSNNWVVSGSHTASGKPLLSNDMHLNLTVPDIWYEADLSTTQPASQSISEPLHVAGVTIPGLPLIVVGHNQHIAWGFTNLGADVQDVYIETTRGEGSQTEFQSVDGSWQPVTHLPELIKVRGRQDESLDVTATRHGDTLTPILTPVLAAGQTDKSRTLALRWTLYDPAVLHTPQLAFAIAHDWPTFLAAVEEFGGPGQNIVYADDQGHIGYHASGRIPLRGTARDPAIAAPLPTDIVTPAETPSATETPTIAKNPDPLIASPIATATPAAPVLASGPLSAVPLVPSQASEWSGYIPFDKLPQVYDPVGGVIATANSRITPDDYPYPITLNWAAPYRNERIWRLLDNRKDLKPSDMLAIQSDIYSDLDRVLAQRIAYAVDHSQLIKNSKPAQRTQVLQAADLLRNFNGQMTADSSAAAIISSVHAILWRVLLEPHLAPSPASSTPATKPQELNQLYSWGERDYALEQIVMHTPPRWLPSNYANWDDLFAAALDLALHESHAPADLIKWRYGAIHTVDLEHPIFSQSPLLTRLLGLPIGSGSKPQSGSGQTIKQVGHTFGPSERFTADLANPDASTLNITTGQSGNPASPNFLDQFSAWYHVTTLPFPFTQTATTPTATHTLTLTP